MLRRRLYGGEKMAAYALVAPINNDGTFYTPNQIAQKLSLNSGKKVVNIVSKFNSNTIKDKKYAYTISNSATSIKAPSNAKELDVIYNCYENNKLVTRLKKGDSDFILKSGSENRYVIVSGIQDTAYCFDGEWLFCGYCNKVYCKQNSNLRYVYYNHLDYISEGNTFSSAQGYTFFSCKNLNGKLAIPNNIKSIERLTFAICNLDYDLEIPSNIERIDTQAFSSAGYNSGRSLIKFSDRVNSKLDIIDGKAFYGLPNIIGALNLPDNISSIGGQAFANMSKLDGILHLPENINTIGFGAFSLMSNILSENNGNEEFIIPKNITVINNQVFSKDMALSGILKIPKRITSIGGEAFQLTSFKTIDLSESIITELNSAVFKGCKKVTSFIFPVNNLITSIGEYALSGLTSLTYLDIPEGVKTLETNSLASWNLKSTGVTIKLPKSITRIGNDTFINTTIDNLYFAWDDTSIVPYNPLWGLDSQKPTITIHVPSGQGTNYKAKGYTGFNIVEN